MGLFVDKLLCLKHRLAKLHSVQSVKTNICIYIAQLVFPSYNPDDMVQGFLPGTINS